ncbi:hypothetical protein AVEN_208978-1 [Araneus ventricosus]|uniref:Integrase zinc-binding domain-containing protein n=1 Tax=Araneus ventricosus TaxID=182803 RepID=A0A4Y2CPL2_ARAVE|nr:hypothetical protein AVEN_208978-1 [Araneus ventricosus]
MNKYSTDIRVFNVLEITKCQENVKAVQQAWQEEFHNKNWPRTSFAVHTIDSEVCSRVMDGFQNRLTVVLVKEEVLRETHDRASGGHFGVVKTLHRTRKIFYWDQLRADVEKWCRQCQICRARRGPKTEDGKSVTGCTSAEESSDRTLRLPCDILFRRPGDTPSLPNET